jgi:hypothetical protein
MYLIYSEMPLQICLGNLVLTLQAEMRGYSRGIKRLLHLINIDVLNNKSLFLSSAASAAIVTVTITQNKRNNIILLTTNL